MPTVSMPVPSLAISMLVPVPGVSTMPSLDVDASISHLHYPQPPAPALAQHQQDTHQPVTPAFEHSHPCATALSMPAPTVSMHTNQLSPY